MPEAVNIQNRKAKYEYEWLDRFTAGLQLLGTEIKSIRENRVSLGEAYCIFKGSELFVKSMHIGEYSHGNIMNHDPLRERKLLLTKRELNKLQRGIQDQGITIIPIRLFVNERGLAKLEIALARGKKLHDKRDSLKEKSMKRDIDRAKAYR